MKNNKLKITLITAIASFAVLLTFLTASVGASNNDPLVTLSYINETVIPKITEDVKNAVIAFLDERETFDPKEPEAPAEPEASAITEADLAGLKYTVVYLEKGQKLFASGEITESTEIILRSGAVVSISPFDDQGIADLTASKELYNNDPLVKNNYCLIPRGGDGRGIYALDSDAYILVRGEYEIVQ